MLEICRTHGVAMVEFDGVKVVLSEALPAQQETQSQPVVSRDSSPTEPTPEGPWDKLFPEGLPRFHGEKQ